MEIFKGGFAKIEKIGNDEVLHVKCIDENDSVYILKDINNEIVFEEDKELFNNRYIILKSYSNEVVFITGGGVSAASDMSVSIDKDDFWNKYKIEDLKSYKRFIEDSSRRADLEAYLSKVRASNPNINHKTIADFERNSPDIDVTIITHNIDSLHTKAGNSKVFETHGFVFKKRCLDCGCADWDETDEKCDCGGELHPKILWFGELIDNYTLFSLQDIVNDAPFVIILGTSLTMEYIESLVCSATKYALRTYIINEDIPVNKFYNAMFIKGKIKDNLKEVLDDISRI